MTDSAMEYKFLLPEKLPKEPTALDARILQGKEIILSKKHDEDDQVINLTFDGFKQTIQEVFEQTITLINVWSLTMVSSPLSEWTQPKRTSQGSTQL